jgi:hypothetical protein
MTDHERMIWAARQLQLARARDDFSRFVPAAIRGDDGAPVHPSILVLAWWAHARWSWERNLHAGIYTPLPVGAFTTALATWFAGRGYRVQVVAPNSALAAHRLRSIRTTLESPQVQRIFPSLPPLKWGAHSATAEPASPGAPPRVLVDCRPVASRGGSPGYDRLILESPADQDNSSTAERQDATRRQVELTWLGALEEGGKALWISPRMAGGPGPVLRERADFAWLDQRPSIDGSAWEQEAYAVPETYPEELAAILHSMVVIPATKVAG